MPKSGAATSWRSEKEAAPPRDRAGDTKMQQDAVMTWAPVAHEGEEKPSPRSAHSLVQNGSEAWMFGGCDKRRRPAPIMNYTSST